MGPPSRNEWIMAALVLLAMFLWISGSNPNISLPLLGSQLHQCDHGGVCRDLADAGHRRDRVRRHRREKSAWEVFFYFTSLLTLSSGLNEIGFIKWVAEGYAKPLARPVADAWG